MTYDEFLAAIPRSGWVLVRCTADGDDAPKYHIRRQTPGGVRQCPITALRDGVDEWQVEQVADAIGLSDDLRYRIVNASDGFTTNTGYDPAVRRDLLVACGLTESFRPNVLECG